MAVFWDVRCEFQVNRADDSIIPNDGSMTPSDGFFIRYDVKATFNNYHDNPSSEGLEFHDTSVEQSHLLSYSVRHDGFQPSKDRVTRDFLDRHCIPVDIIEQILYKVEAIATSWANEFCNAPPNLLLLHADISIWASRYGTDEEQDEVQDDLEDESDNEFEHDVGDFVEDDDMEGDVSSSMEEDYHTCGSRGTFKAVELLRRAKFEGGANANAISSCTVCLEEFLEGEDVILVPCNHVYHRDCILRWLKQSNFCPLCRFKMSVD